MKKSAKLSLTLALMMGITGGVQLMDTNQASAEISDNFRLEMNGVLSYFHDIDHNYYGGSNKRSDGSALENGWNHYTRLVFRYQVDRDTAAYARVHSGYDAYGTGYSYTSNSTYFDQAYLTFKDRKRNINYLLGKRGMTLGQSMVYNSTGNQTGAQVTFGNWYDPNNLMLFWGNRKGGQKVWGAQAIVSPSKAVSFNITYLQSDALYTSSYTKTTNYYVKSMTMDASGNVTGITTTTKKSEALKDASNNPWLYTSSSTTTKSSKNERDKFIDFGAKIHLSKNSHLVGEFAHNMSGNPSNSRKISGHDRGWFVEYYTGPTNDFGSGLPLAKKGTQAFSIRYQDLGRDGSAVHNNTFYDDKKGLRLDYGYVFRKGMSADIVVGRMKDKGTDGHDKGKYSNIVVGSIAYKFK